uniref:Uncharacterized LOC100184058 n=1 Tax=Ciona intestinalis TaxID=7719 RepID=H2XTW2_CIOIN|nr:uncharacterized protein LOC100184058 [Ciona intestinalis]|eukprot:XP_002129547.1 uncharacterized protein LOC100184058 [Ciona intestinalis]
MNKSKLSRGGLGLKLGLVVVISLLVLATSVESRRRMSRMQLKEFVCRRCWSKLYHRCYYGVGLSKRSISESEANYEPEASLEQTSLVSQDTLDLFNGHQRTKRSAGRVRRSGRRRYYRFRINCHICQINCFRK